jgi:hypothetical protein
MLHCDEHVPVLEAAKKNASPSDQAYLDDLQTMSMIAVDDLQRQAKRRMETSMDRLLAELPIVPQFIYDLRIPKQAKMQLKQRSHQRAQRRLIRINVTNLLETFLTLLRSNDTNARIKVVVLLLLTGRRSTEILATGQFIPIPGRTYSCLFKGHLKNDSQEKEYIIPLLAPVDEINKYLEEVRTELGIEPCGINREHYERREAINQKYARQLKRYLNDIIRAFTLQEMKPQDLRALYFLLTFQACAYVGFARPHFAKAVLGHYSLESTTHYESFKAIGLLSFMCPMDITADDLRMEDMGVIELGYETESDSDEEEE